MGPFWGVVFHENISSKSKFRTNGAELFWAPQISQLNCAYELTHRKNPSIKYTFGIPTGGYNTEYR